MSLRKKLIRLAHQKPELRPHLIPLLTKRASFVSKYLTKHIMDPKWDNKPDYSSSYKAAGKLSKKLSEAFSPSAPKVGVGVSIINGYPEVSLMAMRIKGRPQLIVSWDDEGKLFLKEGVRGKPHYKGFPRLIEKFISDVDAHSEPEFGPQAAKIIKQVADHLERKWGDRIEEPFWIGDTYVTFYDVSGKAFAKITFNERMGYKVEVEGNRPKTMHETTSAKELIRTIMDLTRGNPALS